jgi:glycosyltransferase involved in cell wall biosynthesis
MSEPNQNGAGNGASKALVSVIIPAYQCADYIIQTLNSVLAQRFTRYEIVVVNDGSPDTDVMEPLLAPYMASIRYIKQQNSGPSVARNRGVQEARGKYVAFLDSDDLWLPDHLSKQVELLENDPSLGLVYSDSLQLEEDAPIETAFETTPQAPQVTFENLVAERCTIGTSTTVVDRQALLDAGGFEESRHRSEDFDLWLRMAHRGSRMGYSTGVQVCHRVANGLAFDDDVMKQSQINVYEKMLATLPLTAAQERLLRDKIIEVKARLQVEIAKKSLLKDQFPEALVAARQANSVLKSAKLSMAVFGLRFFPHAFGASYRAYAQFLEQRHQSRLARFHRERNPEGVKLGYEAFTGLVDGIPAWVKVGK